MSTEEVLDVEARMDVLLIGVQFFLSLPSVTDLLDNIQRVHTLAPILDPTAYMRGMDNLRWQETVLRAVRDFQKALEPVAEMLAETQP